MENRCRICGYDIEQSGECPRCQYQEIYGIIDLRVKKQKEHFENWLKGDDGSGKSELALKMNAVAEKEIIKAKKNKDSNTKHSVISFLSLGGLLSYILGNYLKFYHPIGEEYIIFCDIIIYIGFITVWYAFVLFILNIRIVWHS